MVKIAVSEKLLCSLRCELMVSFVDHAREILRIVNDFIDRLLEVAISFELLVPVMTFIWCEVMLMKGDRVSCITLRKDSGVTSSDDRIEIDKRRVVEGCRFGGMRVLGEVGQGG